MDQQHFKIPGTLHAVWVDLDDRDKLTKTEVSALNLEIERLTDKRAQIGEKIRKINRRLIQSAKQTKAKEKE